MRSLFKNLFWGTLFLGAVSCGDGGNKLITEQSVGNITFSQEIPDFGKRYRTEETVVYNYKDSVEVPVFVITEKSGGLAARVYPGEMIEVYASEYKTLQGIHAGMNLREAVKITGVENLNLWLEWPNDYFTVEDHSSGFLWYVTGDQLIGGQTFFEEYLESGMPEIGFSHFDPEAVIACVVVVNKQEN